VAKVFRSENGRSVVFRVGGEEVLPDALIRLMREEAVTCGWIRASGVLSEVELRAYHSEVGGLSAERRIAGPVQAITIEGSVGLADGDVSLSLRAVLGRETDRGIETLAGEIQAARVIALEGVVTVLTDLAMSRSFDPDAGVWMLLDGMPQEAPIAQAPPIVSREAPRQALPAPLPPPKAAPAWSEAIAASSAAADRSPQPPRYQRANPPAGGAPLAIPRPIKFVPPTGDDGPFPEAGDMVEHFAFGTCEVMKSDGERLHLRVYKDGRIKEIALEMLKVTLLTTDGDTRRYRLDRRL
jgi:predicted DNA-binding protein with PD1-like motif